MPEGGFIDGGDRLRPMRVKSDDVRHAFDV